MNVFQTPEEEQRFVDGHEGEERVHLGTVPQKSAHRAAERQTRQEREPKRVRTRT